ncbi:MAG: hypothetical protein FWG91_00605 [Lachnospiraceae bacterium]|nr:hypothetical protein [Lachnospiraceae bacterium]
MNITNTAYGNSSYNAVYPTAYNPDPPARDSVCPEASAAPTDILELSEDAKKLLALMEEPEKMFFGDSFNSSEIDRFKEFIENMKANESSDNDVMAIKKQALCGLLKRVEMTQGTYYSSSSWKRLMATYGKTKPISLNDEASVPEIEKAISELNAALSALKKAEKDDDKQRDALPLVMEAGGTAYEQATLAVQAAALPQIAGISLAV